MKNVFVILLFISCYSSAQENSRANERFSILQTELRTFIDTIESRDGKLSKYHVYTVSVYKTLPDTSSLCVEFCYLVNNFNYKYDSLHSVFIMGDETVLIGPNANCLEWINGGQIAVADSVNKDAIKSKLPPKGMAIFNCGGCPKALIWYDGCVVRKRFCEHINGTHISVGWDCSLADFDEVKTSFYNDAIIANWKSQDK